MPAVVLSAAHHQSRGFGAEGYEPGATFKIGRKLRSEAEWSELLVAAMEWKLWHHGYATVILRQSLADTIRALRAMVPGQVLIAIEPHLNADADADRPGDPVADYGQIIRSEANNSASMQALCGRFVERLGMSRRAAGLSDRVRVDTAPLRWSSPPKRLGFIQNHKHHAVITESGFIDSPSFVEWAFTDGGIDAIADAHVSAIRHAFPLVP